MGAEWIAMGSGALQSRFPVRIFAATGLVGPSGVQFLLDLPVGGTGGDLAVEVTTDPENGPWTTLASAQVSSGNPISAGTAGLVTIELPPGTGLFVRLAATEP